jgi:hypothetical protein
MIRALELKHGGQALEPLGRLAVYLEYLTSDEAAIRPGQAERSMVSLTTKVRDIRKGLERRAEDALLREDEREDRRDAEAHRRGRGR